MKSALFAYMTKPQSILLCILATLALCTGCGTSSLAKLIASSGKDHATVIGSVNTIYGTVKVTRVNPETNQTATVSPDGTVTIGHK